MNAFSSVQEDEGQGVCVGLQVLVPGQEWRAVASLPVQSHPVHDRLVEMRPAGLYLQKINNFSIENLILHKGFLAFDLSVMSHSS